MPYIEQTPPERAQGRLKSLYDAAVKRAGRVFHIVSVQSLNPPVLEASMRLYQAAVLGPSPLSRAERELIAVVVSKTNDCFY